MVEKDPRRVDVAGALKKRENALAELLGSLSPGTSFRAGKGSSGERRIEDLLFPVLPPGFEYRAASVVSSENPDHESHAFDRVITDPAGAALIDESHATLPIEAVAGVVERTEDLQERPA